MVNGSCDDIQSSNQLLKATNPSSKKNESIVETSISYLTKDYKNSGAKIDYMSRRTTNLS